MILRDGGEGVHGGWSIGDDGLGRVPSLTAEEGSPRTVPAGCGGGMRASGVALGTLLAGAGPPGLPERWCCARPSAFGT